MESYNVSFCADIENIIILKLASNSKLKYKQIALRHNTDSDVRLSVSFVDQLRLAHDKWMIEKAQKHEDKPSVEFKGYIARVMFGEMDRRSVQSKYDGFFQIMQWPSDLINSIEAIDILSLDQQVQEHVFNRGSQREEKGAGHHSGHSPARARANPEVDWFQLPRGLHHLGD